jgi:hypothetical protein
MLAGVSREEVQNAAVRILAVEPAHLLFGVGVGQFFDVRAQKREGLLEVGNDLRLIGCRRPSATVSSARYSALKPVPFGATCATAAVAARGSAAAIEIVKNFA